MEKFNSAELKYCNGCQEDYCGSCLQSLITNSYEGRLLSAMEPRFSAFAWDDVDKFKQYMGDDVDPLKHGYYQAENVAISFIEHQNSLPWFKPFTREEAKMLYLANVAHDLHEGLDALNRGATADVAAPDKTEDIYEAELLLNLQVVSEVLRMPQEFMDSYRGVVGDLQGWSHAGRAFNCIERCGYFLTGMKAWGMRNHTELEDEENLRCREMAHACVSFNLPRLKEYSHEFRYPGFLLGVYETAIKEIV